MNQFTYQQSPKKQLAQQCAIACGSLLFFYGLMLSSGQLCDALCNDYIVLVAMALLFVIAIDWHLWFEHSGWNIVVDEQHLHWQSPDSAVSYPLNTIESITTDNQFEGTHYYLTLRNQERIYLQHGSGMNMDKLFDYLTAQGITHHIG